MEATAEIGVPEAKGLVLEMGMAGAPEVAWGAAVGWELVPRKAVKVNQSQARNWRELVPFGGL